MDLVMLAWQAAGSPTVKADQVLTGLCSRCSTPTSHGVPTRACISKKFTAFESWDNPRGQLLCPACAWSYREPALRTRAHILTQRLTLTAATTTELCADLLTGPLNPTRALVIPLRPGRKHLIHHATWGRIALDDTTVTWTAADAGRLEATLRLRRHGFGPRMLTQPAPCWDVLYSIPRNHWAAITLDWNALNPWRATPWLPLALYLTTIKENR